MSDVINVFTYLLSNLLGAAVSYTKSDAQPDKKSGLLALFFSFSNQCSTTDIKKRLCDNLSSLWDSACSGGGGFSLSPSE